MTDILKRSKKSCLKIFRKIYFLKQNTKELDEEDDTISAAEFSMPQIKSAFNTVEHNNPSSLKEYAEYELMPSLTSHSRKSTNSVQNCNSSEDLHNDSVNNNSLLPLHSMMPKYLLFRNAVGHSYMQLQPVQQQQQQAAAVVEVIEETPANSPNVPTTPIVFEKVKYKEGVRYLRHSPAKVSIGSSDLIDINSNHSSHNNNNNNDNNMPSLVSLDDAYFFTTASISPYATLSKQTALDDFLNNNVQAASQPDGDDCLTQIKQQQYWQKRWTSPRLEDFSYSQRSNSKHSSSTTLETWLDDDFIERALSEKQSMDLVPNFCY